MILNVQCVHCNTDYEIAVEKKDFDRWESGELIQDAMPYLTPGQRELLISNTCDACWDRLFTFDEGEPVA